MNFSKFFSKKKRKKNKLRIATANELKIKRNASDLWTARHFFSPAIFLLSARDKNRSRTIFGDGGCVSVANYSHVSRREQIRGGKKYRSNVTVPSETEYSLFFFFFIWKCHASPKREAETGNCENLQSFAEEDRREKCFDVLIVIEATFRFSMALFREKSTSGRKCVTCVKC